MSLFALIGFLWKYMPAFEALAQAIEAHQHEAAKQKFAGDFSKGWEDAMQTGDASALHAVINAHPSFRVRE